MKTSSTLCHLINGFFVLMLVAAGVKTASAQIPNGGFEEWVVSDAGFENPVDWESGNTETYIQVTKSDNAFEGNNSMSVKALLSESGTAGHGWAEVDFPINFLPSALKFHVKTINEAGGVSVTIGFYNEGTLYQEYNWNTSATINEWTPEIIELGDEEPVLTNAHIRVEASYGDFTAGTAMIWIDDLTFETVTATDEIKLQSISAYPNPCDDVLHLKGATSGMIYSLSDITGREVASGQLTNLANNIDVSSLTSGVYLLKLGKGASESVRKIIVK